MVKELGNAYPVAPWSLRGDAFQTMSFVRGESARAVVPDGLDFVFRAGGIYFGSYRAGSSLEYNELIVIQGFVRSRGKFGFWISQIYVDHPAALAGGHELWDLPKQLAHFEVDADETQRTAQVRVSREGTTLCALRVQKNGWSWPQRLTWPMLAGARRDFSRFKLELSAKLRRCRVDVEIPDASPLAGLGLDRPFLGLSYDEARIVAHAPERAR